MRHLTALLMLCLVLPLGAQVRSKADLAKQLLQSKSAENHIAVEDLTNMKVSSETFSKKTGLTNVYFQQYIGDIPVHGAILNAHITKGDELFTFNSRFVPLQHGKKQASPMPKLTPEQALQAALTALGIKNTGILVQKSADNDAVRTTIFDRGLVALEDIKMQLVYQPIEGTKEQVRLAWQVEIQTTDHQNWWLARMDAATGELLDKNNYIVSCDWGTTADACHHEHTIDSPHQTYFDLGLDFSKNNQQETQPFSLLVGNQYKVYPVPAESPNHLAPFPPADGRVLLSDPASPTASPFGWHDTNGVAGAEFTTTQGNNVHAYTDTNADNVPDAGSSPDGGATLIFNFPIDLTQAPSTYRPAAVTNLFYMNNKIHDFAYTYGFDEAAGNFQENNYGNGGLGSDYVQAEAQDGSGTNNANFGTPPDGSNPRMQMYIGTNPTPDVDGDLDNGVIAHEYAHGISNRFTGGPANAGCLGNNEQMGEGWSDWYALMMTLEPGDLGTDSRGIGTYLFGQPANGPGIRPTPYSTLMSINPSTYNTIKTAAVPHGVGYVWATMIWDLTWAMVQDHGQAAGFDITMNLVNQGMVLQPCSPGFVDGRNAILNADLALYGGANRCRIWEVFARRGLGFSATQGSSNSVTDGVEAFDIPTSCILTPSPLAQTICAPTNAVYMLTNGTAVPLTLTVSGNPAGTTVNFSVNPVAASGGISTLTIGNTGAAAPGNYTLTITGTNGATIINTTVTLKVFNGSPTAPTLTLPVNMATGQYLPQLKWNADVNAATYDLQLATDAAFTNIVANPTGLTGTSYQTVGLANLTTYYWRVRGVNTCGTGSYSTAFSFTTANISCTTYTSTDVPKTISATGTPTVLSTLTVPTLCGSIVDVNVKNINITHTWIDDVTIEVISPSGTVVRVMDRPCDDEDNILINFDDEAASSSYPCPPTNNGTYIPASLLSAFDGQIASGVWTLRVIDNANQDGGTLNAWGLEICYANQSVTCYRDMDNDTYGDPSNSQVFCATCGSGYVSNNTDCNDNSNTVNPGATEICGNNVDDNCNTVIDEGCCPPGNILYVNASAVGANSGISWANAYTSLQAALANTCPGVTQIWVAKGTYKPTTGTDRTISFALKNNIAIFGGLAGTEAAGYDMSLRNFVTNETILSGEIGAAGTADNSYNVVNGSGTGATAILDGFTVTGGSANDVSAGNWFNPNKSGGGMYNNAGSPTVRYCTFTGNTARFNGGGMFNYLGAAPAVTNCSFTANAANKGGGMGNLAASPTIVNSVFSGNNAVEGGGVCLNGATSPVLTNCSFSGNNATTAGGLYLDSSAVIVNNSIIWGNSTNVGVDVNGSTHIFNNSIVEGGCPANSTCNNVQNTDPLFILQPNFASAPTTVGNLRLQSCSPAMDAGVDADNTTLLERDALNRKFDAVAGGQLIDLGAYEYQAAFCSNPTCGTFTIPANGASTVACPSAATQPTPPTVLDNCNVAVVPTGPVVVNNPNPVTCEGTRTYTWTYMTVVSTQTWSYVYTIERNDFSVPANGAATVACLSAATQPTPPTVLSDCGETLTPTGPTVTNNPNPVTCEGTRTYAWTYTDCEGNTHAWSFVYTIERNDFTLPANGAATVACPAAATQPTPPTVMSDCGETLTPTGPVITNNPNPVSCEGTRTYAWTYTDCEGNSHVWSFVYTIERNPFTVPANGSATVACPALAVAPTLPVVTSNCGETLTPTGPVITNNPNPLSCEGTRTYAYTYTDCEGNTATWSFVYTIERNPFTVPAGGTATVSCEGQAVAPTLPVVTSNCGETLTPTGPVITNSPNPIVCAGTRTYAYTYTDCEGNTATWNFTYTIVPQPFSVPANGTATVACPSQTDVQPVPPVVTNACGLVITPVLTNVSPALSCEGNRIYTWTYKDCAGNQATWTFTYVVEYQDFVMPANENENVECALSIGQITPPVVFDNCGKLITPTGPVITNQPNEFGCEGSRTYAWTYKDCEGNTHVWKKTFNFLYAADFFVYPDVYDVVPCLDYAQPPVPPTIYDICGQEIVPSGPTLSEEVNATGCSGIRTYTYVYTDCGGHSHPWVFTFYINDDQPPVGNCPTGNGSSDATSVNETHLNCIEDVPCPTSYDFTSKIQQLLTAGGFYDLCSGHDLVVTLDSWSALWDCSDPDGDGSYTFGRTFYFRIADQCGNEFPELCSVTYSGACQPLNTFTALGWGLESEDPYESGINLQIIQTLLNNYGPLKIGGGNRSLTLTQAQCVADLLPGTGFPTILGNCNQTNCSGGCNAAGPGGIKNTLAANTIAFLLNVRYNVAYNGLNSTGILSQGLGCLKIDPNIKTCNSAGVCQLHVFDKSGVEHLYPYTLGGLLDLVNYFLGGNMNFTDGASGVYANALDNAMSVVNGNWNGQPSQPNCDPNPGATGIEVADKALPTGNITKGKGIEFSLSPNPASSEVTLKLSELPESQAVILNIYNNVGQVLLHKDFGEVRYINERLDLKGLGNGLYIVSMRAGTERFQQKLVISND